MRYLPTLLDSRRYAAAPRGDLEAAPRGEAGADGDQWLAAIYGGGPDVNPALTGHAKHVVYDEMAKTDASVKSLLQFNILPIRSANHGLNPAVDDPIGRVVQDFVAWNLGLEGHEGELDLSWDELIQQGGKCQQFGAMIEELVWDDVREWRDADGDSHLVRPLARIAPRYPSSIERVKFERGRPVEVTQYLPGTKPIPGEKISYLVFEREGNRWDGVSILRPAWGPWALKKALMIAAGIGWDRFAAGTPVVWHPDNPDAEEKAKAIGRNLRQHERGYVHLPTSSVGQNGKPESDWLVELLNGSQTLADPVPLLRFFTEQIAEAGLQQWSKLGQTTHGSRAVGEVQVDPWFLSVQAFAGYLRRERQRQVIYKLVAVNFGTEAADKYAPVLTISKIQARSVTVIAQAIELLANAGFTFTDRDTQNDVRDLLGLPELPEADLAAAGIDPAKLQGILQGLGLDPVTLARIVNALPPDVGVARNTLPPLEGAGLAA